MDSLECSKKIPKLESLSGSISPINTGLNTDSSLIRYLRGGSPITFSGGNGNDAFSSPEISAKSCGGSNRSFGRSLSPLSSIENVISPPVYGTPVKVVDEDVLLMDGILVDYLSGGRVSRSTSSGSGGSSSNSASSPGIRAYKTEHCRSWEEFGQCRYGSKCQFAHGKEEIRPSFFSLKNDMRTFKSYTSGSSSYSSKSRFLPPVMSEAVAAANPKAISCRPEYKSQSPAVSIKSDYSSKNTSSMHLSKNPTLNKPEVFSGSPIGNIISKYWSPLDDGVDVGLPGYSKKDVDAYITIVLNGPSRRRRLPVFTEFCPE